MHLYSLLVLTAAAIGAQASNTGPHALTTTSRPCAINVKPPEESTCGKRGHIRQDYPQWGTFYSQFVTAASYQCRDFCLAATVGDECGSYAWDESTHTCALYTYSAEQLRFRPSKRANVTFYDAACYTCAGSRTNLNNGDFEDKSLSPWAPNHFRNKARYSLITPGYESKHALQIIIEGPHLGSMYQFSYQAAGSLYTIGFDYQFVEPIDSVIIAQANARYHPPLTALRVHSHPSKIGKWLHAVSEPFKAEGEGVLGFEFGVVNGSSMDTTTILLDNIKFSLWDSGC